MPDTKTHAAVNQGGPDPQFGPVICTYVAAKDMLRSGRIEPPTLRTFNLTAT